MPLPSDIQTLLQNITSIRGIGVHVAQTAGKIYELWLAAQIAHALQNGGWIVEIRAHTDLADQKFIQRGSPGRIHPRTASGPKPSFFYLKRPADGAEFELHNSVTFTGRSGAEHEFDLCILKYDLGTSLRNLHAANSATGHPMYVVECKEYVDAVGIAVPRGVIASVFDATHWKRSALRHQQVIEGVSVTNQSALAGRFSKGFVAIVTPNGFSGGADRLARRYNVRQFGDVEMGTPGLQHFLSATSTWLASYQG